MVKQDSNNNPYFIALRLVPDNDIILFKTMTRAMRYRRTRNATCEQPRVLEGEGFGIVENDFEITVFDLDDMNFRLKKIPRIYKRCYEDRLYPTSG